MSSDITADTGRHTFVYTHFVSVCVGGGVHTHVRLSVTECLKLVVLHEMKEKQKRHSRANYV